MTSPPTQTGQSPTSVLAASGQTHQSIRTHVVHVLTTCSKASTTYMYMYVCLILAHYEEDANIQYCTVDTMYTKNAGTQDGPACL